MGLHDFTIYDALRRNAQILSGAPALIDHRGTLTYRGLLEEVDRLESGLRSTGMGKGDRVIIMSKNCREYVTLYLAAAKMGAILVPINWRLKPDEISHIVEDSTPNTLFIADEFRGVWNEMSKRHHIPVSVSLDSQHGNDLSYSDLLERPDCTSALGVSDDDPYIIIYTAAVDGRARGAMLSQRNLLQTSWQVASTWRLTESDVNLCFLPLFHALGALILLSVLSSGGRNVIMQTFDSDEGVDSIEKHGVTVFGEFAPILKNLLEKAQGRKEKLSSLRHVIGIDLPETVKEFERVTRAQFWAGYGQTETSGLVTMAPYFEKPGSAGRALPFTCVEVENEQGLVLPANVSGEIVIRGPSVFKGYWNLEGDTVQTFRFERHHTGDVGRIDESGNLYYQGRLPEKELIKPGGENVYPGEVELVIMENQGISEVCVLGVPDPEWGEAIVAVCVLKPGIAMEEKDLIDFVAARIARYKKPKRVIFVTELPKNNAGIVDRNKVKAEHGMA